ncbi:KpsF/GutQ family sugar-phosphate isomerase [Gayadomonas joobiniege]|uniref:KpsF/GutQ family sugar-phosphate isomerase n=1 Tax=Gayadomonas joobiniege TaxID=1234606 RepID=UPI0003648D7D|nr:KpsF/GutQ family sugar-phosphate isomerase [Gayadomonas joobiniege]
MSSIGIAKRVINNQIDGLKSILGLLDDEFDKAVELILATDARVIVSGIGKSGMIGKKIAASLASTGTPSFFLHPSEAFHGDLGMLKPGDILLAISKSGESNELLKLLPFLRDNQNPMIAMTADPNSTIARHAVAHLNTYVESEACPLQLAPTTSSTAALVMGDALTVALMEKRQFAAEHFARFHPGGSLGKRLLSIVDDEMVTDDLPVISPETELLEVLHAMSKGRLGIAIVAVADGEYGIITDGDVRRAVEQYGQQSFAVRAEQMMSLNPRSVSIGTRVEDALNRMQEKQITTLLVFNGKKLAGVFKK